MELNVEMNRMWLAIAGLNRSVQANGSYYTARAMSRRKWKEIGFLLPDRFGKGLRPNECSRFMAYLVSSWYRKGREGPVNPRGRVGNEERAHA